jgi:hypothetical protein
MSNTRLSVVEGVTERPMSTLIGTVSNWLKGRKSEESRNGSRNGTPPLVAYFWDGGSPVAHIVRNISPSGFYLATDERWLLGTLVMMTLQRTRGEALKRDCSLIVMSKVVRHGEDGVGFEFIPIETSGPGPQSQAADRKTLDRFLHLLASDSA